MKNAVKYWGAQAGGTADGMDATCAALTAAATGTATCNGNGDGQIDGGTANFLYETYRAWQHLANAGLVEGQYSGVAGSGGYADSTPGVNVPASKRTSGAYMFDDLGVSAVGSTWFPTSGNQLWLGADNNSANAYSLYPLLTTAEMYSFDQKMDDGLPGTGIVKTPTSAAGSYAPNCATTADPTTAVYNLTYSGPACSIMMNLGF